MAASQTLTARVDLSAPADGSLQRPSQPSCAALRVRDQALQCRRLIQISMAAGAGDAGLGGGAAGFAGEGDDEEDMEREAPELLEPPERRHVSPARVETVVSHFC